MKKKLVVLGLDGVSWPMLQRLMGEGVTPRLKRLVETSQAGPMYSTLPEISPVAWTTFYTAKSPCEHGIFGFTEFEPGGYDLCFNSSGRVKSPYIWDWLSMRARESVVLNVPLTYPARPLNGVMVSGFVALDYERASYPLWVADYLKDSGYRLEADFERVHQDRNAFLEDLDNALEGREKLMERFWPGDWDLFTLVITDTDRLFHFFLKEFEEGGLITQYYYRFFRKVDEIVGKVYDRVQELAEKPGVDIRFMMLSDHGFTTVKQEFHLNRWLARNGFLSEVGPNAGALALDPTRIYINTPPKFNAGRVGQVEKRGIVRDIIAGLRQEPAVRDITAGDEVYKGKWKHLAPDLLVRPNPGYEFKAKFNSGDVYTSSPLQGTHTFENAFYLLHDFCEQPVKMAEINDIKDLGMQMFSYFGV